MSHITALGAMLAVLLIGSVTGALHAQTNDGLQQGSSGMIALPENDGVVLPGPEQALAVSDERFNPVRHSGNAGQEPVSRDWISPLRPERVRALAREGIWRADGERESVDFALYVADPGLHDHLTLVAQSGINLLPERSQMLVQVNGVELDPVALSSFERFAPTRLALPEGVLRAGRNELRIDFRHAHRIYCGPEAAFELWTDLDLTRSGVSVSPAMITSEPDVAQFLMALAAEAGGNGRVQIRGTEALENTAAAWSSHLVMLINRMIAGEPVAFAFEDYWSVAPARPARARITIIPSNEKRVSFRNGSDGATVMVVQTPPDAQPFDLLEQFGHDFDLTPARNGFVVAPLHEAAFSDFGIRTERFSERYARRDYPFQLPDDWLVLTAAKARIHFDYVYAEGLPRNSMLLLRINGEAVRLLPLRDEGGQYITRFPIDFEARLMHPGTNMLSFEVMIPGAPADLPCAAAQNPVLEISDSSTLLVPFSPSMWIPDMAMAFASFSSASPRANDLSARAFSQNDALTLSAAFAQLPGGFTPGVLHLLSFEDLGSVPNGRYAIDRRLLENKVLASRVESEALATVFGDQPVTDPFVQRTRIERTGLRVALGNGWQFIQRQGRELMQRMLPTSGDQLNIWLEKQRGQAVLVQLDQDRSREIWMMRSPDSDIHAIASALRAARLYGEGPRGQVSVLGHDGRWTNWIAPDRRPVMLEPFGLGNMRYAMGNIVSARPIFYTVLLLAMALASAGVALRLVISTREHKT